MPDLRVRRDRKPRGNHRFSRYFYRPSAMLPATATGQAGAMDEHEVAVGWRRFPAQLDSDRADERGAGALPRRDELLDRAVGPGVLARLRRALWRLRLCQRVFQEPARSAGHIRARLDRADRAGDGGDVAAHLYGGGDQSAVARRRAAGARPCARARLGGLVAFVNDHPLLSGLARLRLRHDPLAALRHPGGADRGAPLRPPAGLHARLRARPDGDHGGVRPGAGGRRLSADRARSRAARASQSAGLSRPGARSGAGARRARCAISICSGSPAS